MAVARESLEVFTRPILWNMRLAASPATGPEDSADVAAASPFSKTAVGVFTSVCGGMPERFSAISL
jgi:hypothetical protein